MTPDQINILLIVFAMFVLVVFFFMPNQRRSKNEARFAKSLVVGDKVVTIGGIHGVIIDLADTQVMLQMEDRRSRILIEKAALSFEATSHAYPKEKRNQLVGKVKKK